jgi:hypothetical protein
MKQSKHINSIDINYEIYDSRVINNYVVYKHSAAVKEIGQAESMDGADAQIA